MTGSSFSASQMNCMQMASPDRSLIVGGESPGAEDPPHLASERRSLQRVNGSGSAEIAGSRGVSTLVEPNLLVQSCVKNVRDLFQALSRCGFTSVNPFTHRSPAVRLPHVTARRSRARHRWQRRGLVRTAPGFGEVPGKCCRFFT